MNNYHFIAIGGAVMHNLALALVQKGYQVTGSDDEIYEPSRTRLEKAGILPEKLGCKISDLGFIAVDPFQKTSLPGVYACGDNVTQMRSVANAVAAGTLAGAMLNKELVDEEF